MAKGIYEKLLRLMEAVDHIEKRGRNKAQNYDYLMAEDVINEVRQECIKEKLVIIPACQGQNVITGETKSGGNMYLTTTDMTFTICDAESGESIVVPWQGQGQDSGDKGIYKAFTGADKYFLRNLLLIPTGDDPENDGTPAKQRTTTSPQPPRQQTNAGGNKPANITDAANKAFGANNVTVTDNPVTEADAKSLIAEMNRRDGGWKEVGSTLNAHGAPIQGKEGNELKAIVMEHLQKFTRAEFDVLMKKVKALPYKSAAKKEDNANA